MVVVVLTEVRRHHVRDNAGRGHIRNGAFERSHHINTDSVVIDGNDQEKTVSDILTAQFPVVTDAMCVVFDRLAVRGRNDDNGDLGTVLLLKSRKFGFKRTFLFGRQKVCSIGDISHFRYRKQVSRRYRAEKRAQPKEERTDEKAEAIKVWPEL